MQLDETVEQHNGGEHPDDDPARRYHPKRRTGRCSVRTAAKPTAFPSRLGTSKSRLRRRCRQRRRRDISQQRFIDSSGKGEKGLMAFVGVSPFSSIKTQATLCCRRFGEPWSNSRRRQRYLNLHPPRLVVLIDRNSCRKLEFDHEILKKSDCKCRYATV